MKKNKHIRLLTAVVALGVILVACVPASESMVARSDLQREMKLTIPESDISTLVGGNNAFAVDLYQSLRSKDGNLIYSPYSISLALAMTYAGARGETESQIANAMHFDLRQDQLHPAFNALDLALEKESLNPVKDQEPLTLNIANAVWAEQTYPFLQNFLDLIAINYGAGIHQADFINNYDPARKEINGWVSDKTNDKIKDLLPDGSLNSDTRMVLVNAIYFKADWLDPFDANSTSDAPFHLLDGSTVEVPMMHQGISAPYVQGDGYQAVALPYAGNTAEMDILIPDEGNFTAFETALSEETLSDILGRMQSTSMSLSLPKFTFSSDFSLVDQLAQLGMSDAFDGNRADFSGMTGNKDLFVSDVIHKAFVAVDEKGTEAAAATAVIMEATSAILYDVNLTLDRPFIFVIRDVQSRQVLFIGRVLSPAK